MAQDILIVNKVLAGRTLAAILVPDNARMQYVGLRLFLDPALVEEACKEVIALWPSDVDMIASIGTYGTPFGIALGYWAYQVRNFRGPCVPLKADTWPSTRVPHDLERFKNKTVVLCDDLINSGYHAYRVVQALKGLCELPLLVAIFNNVSFPNRSHLEELLCLREPRTYALCAPVSKRPVVA